jgi:serine phosphatase RsbU (regulator of sigma subunit)
MVGVYVDEETRAVESLPRGVSRGVRPLDRRSNRRVARAAAHHGLESELELARVVQQQFLPRNTKSLATIRIAAAYVPAGKIGGDYYDFLDLGPQSLGFTVADVSGKGIAAALLVANLQASVRSECVRGFRDLLPMLERINAHFFQATLPEQYATAFFGQYDDSTRRLRYVNCGQQPAILIRNSGFLERLKTTALPLGVIDRWNSEEEAVELRPGDTLCVCSDGVVEAGIDIGEEFGEQGLISILKACQHRDVQVAVSCVVDKTCEHRQGGTTDDVTVVAIRSV